MVINSSEKSPFEIRDSTGKEFNEIYDNQGILLFKNWNEIQGSPPIAFRGYGKNLTECRIYGNTVQNGTPTPENPVEVQGCGVWDETQHSYKLPLTVNGTEYPIYLGQVETTRRITKLGLTGNEAFYKNYSQSTSYLYYAERTAVFPGLITRASLFCNELQEKTEPPMSDIGININNNFNVVYFNFGAEIMNAQPSGNTVSGLKEYLTAQYAAGTPVTIWYVLAKPKTGIVNEPLQKMGDYSDELSIADIPTINGINTISADTTVQPSEIYIKGKIKSIT